MNTLKYEAVRTLTLFFIRVLPIVQNVVMLLFYIEMLHSIHVENYNEVYNEQYVLQYIEYTTPIANFITSNILDINLLNVIFLWVLSVTFRFCEYHRIFVYNNLFCVIGDMFMSNLTYTAVVYVYAIGMSILVIIGMLIALYLHQKHKGSM